MPPTKPSITKHEVHVWRIRAECTRDQIDAMAACLDQTETARADAYRFAQDRDRFIVFRGALREVLGHHLGLHARQVALAVGAQGKPCLAAGTGPHFNLAHCEGLALLAVCAHAPVGIDIETPRQVRNADRLAARVFSPDERRVYDSLSADDKPLAFLRCWTRKEAYVKATGEGLSLALDRFSVAFAPADAPRLLHVDGRPGEEDRWELHDLGPLAGGVAALAIERRGATVRWFDWPGDADGG